MNRLLALSLFAVATSLASCEVTSSGGKFMQWDDPGARAGKIALVSLHADIQGLNPAEEPDLARLEAGLMRDLVVAVEDGLHERFDVQPAKGFVADANYQKHAGGSKRGVLLQPVIDGQKLARLTATPDETLPGDLAAQLASDLDVRYVAVLQTRLWARVVEVSGVSSIQSSRSSPVKIEQRKVFAETRLTIYNRVGFPVVEAAQEAEGAAINLKGSLVRLLKERQDPGNSAIAEPCKAAAAAVRNGLDAILAKVTYGRNSIDYDG